MKVQYFMDSVEVTPKLIIIRKGLKKILIRREELIGLEYKPLTGTTVFITARKRYKVSLWHGHKKLEAELLK